MTNRTGPHDLHRAAVDLATDLAAVLVDRGGSLPAEDAYRLAMEAVRVAGHLLRAAHEGDAWKAAPAWEAAALGAQRIVVALDRMGAHHPLPEEAAAVSSRASRLSRAIAAVAAREGGPGPSGPDGFGKEG